MKKLIPPQLNSVDIYKDIVIKSRSSDKKLRLEKFEDYVMERYSIYENLKSQLENITESDITETEDKDALQSCYTRNSKGYLEGEVVVRIIQSLSIQHRNNCPYCGLDKPRTIDHYLPKSAFPEFSVFPPNLIPCCSHCNQKKSSTWLKEGKRQYINLYFDNIPEDIRFLYTILEYENDALVPTISFNIENKFDIDDDLFELIRGHYINLNLLEEFSESVEDKLSVIFDEIVQNPETSIEEHKRTLNRKYRTSVRKYGLNHWETSFLEAVISSEKFFDNSVKFGA